MKIKCLAVPPYGTNCYVLEDGGQAAVIDPGESAGEILKALEGLETRYLLLTHGHYYNVSLGIEGLYQEAVDRDCDIAMYGHTHRPFLDRYHGVTILNPGSLSYPRQEGRKPSYMIMYMEEDGSVRFERNFLS